MPVDLLIYMVIAAVLIIWLRNTLGTRNGDERDRSADYEALIQNKGVQQNLEDIKDLIDINGNVVDHDLKDFAPDLSHDLRELMKSDPSFDPKSFVEGAKEAFVMIVEAFAKGDLRTLKDLLSPGVYTAFSQAIDDRRNKGESVATEIHAVRTAEILNITRFDRMVFIKIRFIADETCVIKDREGTILSGNPDKITTMNDVWTFGREAKSKDPTWFLYETADDEAEDHKTPVPDAK
ncbi:MAG TPA: Tim44/TimA family putative adaptor protein [Alphaproteobacteria bacterium]|nr:Tim44/TimA family putative adaptor protein [Alphaproteobacteria bacterium]HNS43659.1 Tim44/TimA family putative adaptor protein [Alphaproteobacteria bacterium]